MSIDHLVISGGGHNILPMFGAVKFLVEKEYINFSNINTFDGTSAGALLGFTLLTGIDLEEIEVYLVKRPWEKIFSITPEQIFGAFKSKGLFDVTLIQQILTPLMNAADISIDITFLEFYEKNSIEFTVYATELNSLETEYFSYKTTPNMRILDGLYISSAVPPLFKPCIKDNKCYLDGGVFSNYPIDEFLKRHPDIDENKIFGIKCLGNPNDKNDSISEESTITDYLSCTIKKLIQQIIIHKDNQASINNELMFHSTSFTYNTLKSSISSSDERERLIGEGKRRASEYYLYKMKGSANK
jgi:predicted acylesterase/phospholipase RssA